MNNIYILGSDRRYDLIAKDLCEQGYPVFREGRSKEKAIYLLHPSKKEEEVLAFFRKIQRGSFVFLSRAGAAVRNAAAAQDLRLFALADDPHYLLINSTATAEGVLGALISQTSTLLSELKVLLCGYGNCGRSIAKLLSLSGCTVKVFSREGSMKKASSDGFEVCPDPVRELCGFDVIINTVPTSIFGSDFLNALHPGTLFFQIASGFSGIIPQDMEKRNVFFLPLPGLPGKVAPRSEALAIEKFIKQTLDNQNESG